jgi:hypothetical protein
MSDDPRVLISRLGICALAWNEIESFAVLALVTRNHVDRLLEQVEIEILVAKRGRKVEIAIDEGLRASIEQSVDIGLVPTSLLDRLKLAVEIIQPLADVPLIRL